MKTREQIKAQRVGAIRTVAKYAVLTVSGVLLFRATATYALAERGYQAVGGEAAFLLLPVVYYLVSSLIGDFIKNLDKRGPWT